MNAVTAKKWVIQAFALLSMFFALSVQAAIPFWGVFYPATGTVDTSSAEILVRTNENGNAYFVLLPGGATAPTSAQVKAGQDASGTPVAAGLFGSVAMTAETETSMTATGTFTDGHSTAYDIYVVAEDSLSAIMATPSFMSIAVPNTGPTITSTAITTATEDVLYSYTFTTTADPDGDTVTFVEVTGALPAWLSFVPGTGVLSGTPGNDDVGTVDVRLRAYDGYWNGGGYVDEAFTITVANANDAPTGSVTITGTATEGETLTASNDLADIDGLSGAITYQWNQDGVGPIAGATSDTYVLVTADVGEAITVTASYTDDRGTAESVDSDPTAAVASDNSAPTGTVTITGTPTQGQTLTAVTTTLADADGMTGATLLYQWNQDGVGPIAGATGNTYFLLQADVGQAITVTVSYTDDGGTPESVTSDPTAAVANLNDAPTGVVTITGTATEDETLTASNTLADVDGLGAISYQWNHVGSGPISGATASTYVLVQADVGHAITVTASYTDGGGTAESVDSSATDAVANLNNAPTGSVTISGTATLGQDLTASNTLADDDGLGTISYQWNRAGSPISGATSGTYTLVQADVGQAITVTASYTDGEGTAESVDSSATSAVASGVVVTAPGTVTVNATGLFTEVDFGTPTAVNALGDPLTATADLGNFLSPGPHIITWTATDAGGNSATDTQTVNVNPLVVFSQDQTVGEGATVTVRAILNGTAASYPVTVPFVVTSTATNTVDFTLVSGSIVIASGTEGSLAFPTVNDGVGDPDETITITMGTPINAAVGTHNVHTVTLAETNIAPQVSLAAIQATFSVTTVPANAGDVVVSTQVSDPNPGDTHSYDWSGSNNALAETDGDVTDGSFTFSPTTLPPGLYTLRVTVTDDGSPAKSGVAKRVLKVIATAPSLTAVDSDGDGINDDVEGYGDSDGDGIPDYADAISASNVLQTIANTSNRNLIETESGLQIRLGDVALAAGNMGAEVDYTDIGTTDDGFTNIGGLFDFTVSGLPVAGQSVRIVLPQASPIPANAVYRKLISGVWQDFVVDANNLLASAPGSDGVCPPAGSADYVTGLVAGSWCVQLTIEDGGLNDADGAVDNSVEDPSGVAQLATAAAASGGGGGCAFNANAQPDYTLLILVLVSFLYLAVGRRRKQS